MGKEVIFLTRREEAEWKKKIDDYKERQDIINENTKVNKSLGAEIKSFMYDNDMNKFSSDNFTATITKKENEELNEELAIEIIKKNLSTELRKTVIKKKEYIDDDALEKLVYNGQFDIQLLQKAKIIKPPTITLRISKKKGD